LENETELTSTLEMVPEKRFKKDLKPGEGKKPSVTPEKTGWTDAGPSRQSSDGALKMKEWRK